MILSMTGYGRAEGSFEEKKLIVELRSLNSKQLDVYFKIPSEYKEKEIGLRGFLNKEVRRGKVECVVTSTGGINKKGALNKTMAKLYYDEIKDLESELGFHTQDYISVLVRMPDVMQSELTEISQEEWDLLQNLVEKAAKNLTSFRADEGKKLENDLKGSVQNITDLLEEILPLAESRVEHVRNKIRTALEGNIDKENVDETRFEQELIYYLEKLDINEEVVRLRTHLNYFNETLDDGDSNGKKLGFISQELGREINTLGAKSYNADMQKVVVQMKDQLEKIKEQVLNVL
ncbi:MAG: YicC family protein [Flavobacteriales bacterium]|nr:YicC family protein [Flavobacteriales bacterium]